MVAGETKKEMFYHMRKLLLALPILVFATHSQAAEKPMLLDLKTAYGELLGLFPEKAQGKGRDRGKVDVIADQPMTYGLVLSAEALRYRALPTDEGKRRVRQAARWLLDNSRLAEDGKIGWGLPFAWNEYPQHTGYTITTAVVLEGLLDALTLGDFWKKEESERILKAVREAQVRWCREMWVENHAGGYFHYSTHDAGPGWFCVNAPAMFLGAMARFHIEHASAASATERKMLAERMDKLARAIVATVELREGAPYWKYIIPPNKHKSDRPNDLVHQVYILWGVEHYRDARNTVELPWNRAGAMESLERFWKDGTLRFFAQDEETVKPGNREAPSNLWGIGMLLAAYGKWGTPKQSARCFSSMVESHGPFPGLRVLPREVSSDGRFFLRDGAHVLFGLAHAVYPRNTTGDGR